MPKDQGQKGQKGKKGQKGQPSQPGQKGRDLRIAIDRSNFLVFDHGEDDGLSHAEWERSIPCESHDCPLHPTVGCGGPCRVYDRWLAKEPKDASVTIDESTGTRR